MKSDDIVLRIPRTRPGARRYHAVIQAAQKLAYRNPKVASRGEELIRKFEQKIEEHKRFIIENGVDPVEIAQWRWSNGQ